MNNRGMTILETLVGLVIVGIATMSIAAAFSSYWTTAGKFKKEAQSKDIAILVMSDIFDSPWIKISKLCDAKDTWKQKKTSDCASIDLRATKIETLQVSTADKSIPLYSTILGKNLAGFSASGSVNPSCVDLIQCKNILSNGLMELTFSYHFLSPQGADVQEKQIVLRRGAW